MEARNRGEFDFKLSNNLKPKRSYDEKSYKKFKA